MFHFCDAFTCNKYGKPGDDDRQTKCLHKCDDVRLEPDGDVVEHDRLGRCGHLRRWQWMVGGRDALDGIVGQIACDGTVDEVQCDGTRVI